MEDEKKAARLNGKLMQLIYKIYQNNKNIELQSRDNKSIPKYIKNHIRSIIEETELYIDK
jgi:hypothetical protein